MPDTSGRVQSCDWCRKRKRDVEKRPARDIPITARSKGSNICAECWWPDV